MKKLILSALLAFASLNTPLLAQTFEIEGHRGSRGLMPENTIEAFKKAIDLGVNTLELDVCITKDNKVVVSHEPYMLAQYMSKPDGTPVSKQEEKSLNLYQMTYKEIKQYDSGIRGNAGFPEQQKVSTYKPLLSEMIKACEAYIKKNGLPPVKYNVEIKSGEKEYGIYQPATVEEFSDLVHKDLKKLLPADRIILQSFDFAVLKHWKKQIDAGKYMPVQLSALTGELGPEATFDALGFLPVYYSPYFKLVTPERVKACHDKNVKLMPWTVNEISDMKKMKELGTDGLITDYPNRVKSIQ
ncbi:glycerophosphodiester phosphodiesterase family protein [Flectobacillus sp. BAB-3569]|uniref:glycerophosphodiester phosphodiesterase family protein n=1 Tax=Flectobacillus sp. BAB-3569 TaxID=1509483 RepID=UPI000BA3E253|nr:glycerophosphodiester phosphodiesterase family protein [Flectobacillus sp. BAB-3569]PAC32620.1 glycerophosphodiester phosphodiesterase [Flectobacillus sp. BAB-3569]